MNGEQLDLFENPLGRARQLKAQGDLAGAREALLQFVRASPGNLSAKAALADIQYRTGHLKEALVLAGEILRRDPEDPRALVVTGNVFLKKKKPAEALEAFRAALQVAETDYLWLREARCLLELKQPAEAEAALERARREPPGWEYLRLGIIAASRQGNRKRAEELVDMAARQADADPDRFAEQMIWLLSECRPQEAAALSARARANGGQEKNPRLLLFEARSLARARELSAARERLAQIPPGTLAPELEKEALRLRRRVGRSSSVPGGFSGPGAAQE